MHVRFDRLMALNDVTFELQGGEAAGVDWADGAGEDDIAAVAGVRCSLIQAGTIGYWIRNRPRRHGRSLNQIGFTSDTPALYDVPTVSDYLRFVGMGYDLPSHEVAERTDFWLEKLWLTEKKKTKIKGLSRGMQQRVAIARTLLPNPVVVLLDEPAAGLDPLGRVQFRQLLVSLREQGKAIIISSHILSDLGEYCTHIGIMSSGKMVRFGTVQEVTEHTNDGLCSVYGASGEAGDGDWGVAGCRGRGGGCDCGGSAVEFFIRGRWGCGGIIR